MNDYECLDQCEFPIATYPPVTEVPATPPVMVDELANTGAGVDPLVSMAMLAGLLVSLGLGMLTRWTDRSS